MDAAQQYLSEAEEDPALDVVNFMLDMEIRWLAAHLMGGGAA